MESFTAVVLPVREAETIVRQRAIRVGHDYLPRDQTPVAHITLLTPFLDLERVDAGVVAELGDFFADVITFPFALTEVFEFPGGTTCLAPEPADVFRRLTQGLHRLFPECPPYGGAFDHIVPHLTVPLPDDEDTGALRTALHRRLPLDALATEAVLLHAIPGATRALATFTFGSTAA